MKFPLFAKKSLGQHFLNSPRALEQIIDAARIREGDTILEIGPGTGVLTRALLRKGAHVVAIEKDARAISVLKDSFKEEIFAGKLELMEGDVLEMFNDQFSMAQKIPESDLQPLQERDRSSIFDPASGGIGARFSIVANIPYYITGAILERFLEHGPRPERMVLLVQKEVADRIIARDGKESILSLSVKAFGTPRIVATVPRGAFTPPPSVDSAILSIAEIADMKFREHAIATDSFFRIVKAGFAHRRKLLIRNLESIVDRSLLEEAWARIGFEYNLRAEDMPVERWFDLVSNLSTQLR